MPEKDEAWSTNYDICRVSITNTSPKWETLTTDNKAADGGPKFSPDGKKLAWRAQKKAGYEADKWDILVADCKPDGTLDGQAAQRRPAKYDLSVNEFAWNSGYDRAFFFTADYRGQHADLHRFRREGDGLQAASTTAVACGSLSHVARAATCSAYTEAAMDHPAEVYGALVARRRGRSRSNVSRANDDLLAELDLPRPESVEVPVEGEREDADVDPQAAGLRRRRRSGRSSYLVHGGPQGAWEDGWSFRWNPQAVGGAGLRRRHAQPARLDRLRPEVRRRDHRRLGRQVLPRPRRRRSITSRSCPTWTRTASASAGGSFGGYMMNWFAVNDIAKRFKCLITHCSVWNFESMWGTTDELWFDEWEHGGLPWEKPGKYARVLARTRRPANLGKYKTPMLVIHNDLDFRCPIGQGHELFTRAAAAGRASRGS